MDLETAVKENDTQELIHQFESLKDKYGFLFALSRLRMAVVTEVAKSRSVADWFNTVADHIQDSVQQAVTHQIVKMLCNLGNLPTEYSMDNKNNLIIQTRHKETLRQYLAPDIYGKLMSVDLMDNPDPKGGASRETLEAFDEGLGVPFFANLFVNVRLRLRFLSPEFAAWYILEITEGIFSGTGIDISLILAEEIGEAYFFHIQEQSDTGEDLPLPLHKLDMLCALGCSEYIITTEDGFYITEEGYMALERVYSPFWNRESFLEVGYPLQLLN